MINMVPERTRGELYLIGLASLKNLAGTTENLAGTVTHTLSVNLLM
jgi:hypothetical protein